MVYDTFHNTRVVIVYENCPFRNLKDGVLARTCIRYKALKMGYFQFGALKYSTDTKSVLSCQKNAKLAETGGITSVHGKLMEQYEESLLE